MTCRHSRFVCSTPSTLVIWTVFLRRWLRRTSYSMIVPAPASERGPVRSPATSPVGLVLGEVEFVQVGGGHGLGLFRV